MSSPSYLHLFQQGRTPLSLAILSAVTLVALDVLIVNTVLPTILRELGGIELYAWAVGAYSLGNFMTIPLFSVLVSKSGGRVSLFFSIGIFLAGACIAALAPTMHWVVGGRFLQGLGAGGFFAIPFALITRFYPAELRPRAVGLVSAVWGVAAVAGPLVGAAILKLWGWHWVFWFNLPVGGVILLLALWALKDEGPPLEPAAKLNFIGPLCFALATALILEALVQSFPRNLFLGVGAAIIFFLFLKHEKRVASPAIPPDVWRPGRPLSIAFWGMALSAATFGAAETFLPLLLQGLWQASPLKAGLILTVGSLGWSFTSMGLARYAGFPRRLTQMGTVLLFAGMFALLWIVYFHGAISWIYLSWLICGLGMGQVTPTYNTLAMDRAADYPSGVATGTLLLALTWGFALGAPLAGVFARIGFNEGFDPRMVGLGILPSASREALSMGGLLALGTGLVLILAAGFFAFRMPERRELSE